jgi:hypothetical protein
MGLPLHSPNKLPSMLITHLQRAAGNASISQLLNVRVQRQESGGMSTSSGTSAPAPAGPSASVPTASQLDAKSAADDAVKDFSQAKFRGINDWSGVAESVRIQLLEKATDTGLLLVGPRDEWAIEDCWSSFGGNFAPNVRAHPVIWGRSVDRGADPERISQTRGAFETFKKDVSYAANKDLDANEDRVVAELLNFGIEPPWDLVRLSQPDRNKVGSDRGVPTVGGPTTTDMLAQQSQFAKLLMKYDLMLSRLEKSIVGLGLPFQPGTAPPPGERSNSATGRPSGTSPTSSGSRWPPRSL